MSRLECEHALSLVSHMEWLVLFGIVHYRTLCLLAILMQITYHGKNVNTADGFENW